MREVALLAIVVVSCSRLILADVTMSVAITASGTNAPGLVEDLVPTAAPRLKARVQGNRGRIDIISDGVMEISWIIDLLSRQMVVLTHSERTAEVVLLKGEEKPRSTGPRVKMRSTGRRMQTVGLNCEEFRLTIANVKLPLPDELAPEARELVKTSTLAMAGVSWVATSAPGATEVLAFFRESGESLEELAQVPFVLLASRVQGISCLTETKSSVKGPRRVREALEGDDGLPKLRNELLDFSTSSIDDDVFRVPADYEIVTPSAASPRARR